MLTLKNISKTYPNGTRALNNISLTIPNGMFGLLGPNGAGKSSLMRTLATLQKPDSGEIYLNGINILEQPAELRKTLGYLPQQFGLLPKVSAEKLLNHFAVLKGIASKGERKEITEDLLHKTNLWEKRKHKVGGFSGGMKQRFGVAVALLGRPKLLIVDEPTAGLDPAERVRFLNLLSELGEESVVLLSTHIVEDVAELCTRMAVINQGTILVETSPLQAVAHLQGKIWRKVVDRFTLPALEKIYRIVSTKLLSGQTLIHIYAEEPPPGFEPVPPTLEDAYFCTLNGFAYTAKRVEVLV
jgi:ABC-type multidrug transport system ATPase subunit